MSSFARTDWSIQRSFADHELQRLSTRRWGQGLLVLILATWAASFFVGFKVSLLVLTSLGFGLAILGLRRQSVGLFGIGILCALDGPNGVLLFTGEIFRYNTFNYWLIVVLLLSLPFLLRLKSPLIRVLQVFILLLVFELAITADPIRGILHIVDISVMFAILVYFASSARDEEIWYWLALVMGVLAGAGALSFYLGRTTIPYVNLNVFGFFPLTALFAICMGFPSVSKSTARQFTLAGLAAVNFFWIFLTGSRGDLLIAVFCMLFLIFESRGLLRRLTFIIAVVVVGIGLSSLFANLQLTVMNRIGILLNSDLTFEQRTSGRSDLAVAGWNIFLENPFGIGTGGFPSAWAKLGNLEGALTFGKIGREFEAHSAWIETLAENGVPGVLLLGVYVLLFFIVGLRTSKRGGDHRALGLLVTTALGVAFISTEFQGKGLWFLAAGVTTLFYRDEIDAILYPTPRTESVTSTVPRIVS